MELGDPREPREPREPRPGAETAAAPRWEETKTFYDNLAPKKKPKSVTSGPGYGGGLGKGHRGEGRKPPREGPVAALREGRRLLSTRMRRAVGAGSRLFWELRAGVDVVVLTGARVPRQDPLPHAVIRAQLL